jgi:class 3 adenylate cyclase
MGVLPHLKPRHLSSQNYPCSLNGNFHFSAFPETMHNSSYQTSSEKNVAIKALDCAVAMWQAAQNYSFRGRPIQIGIGLNYGTVFCGNVGNDRKRQFTVLGHPVNLASRFESLTKELNAPIIIGENFYDHLPPSRRRQFQEFRNVKVRGLDAVTCYGYLG